MSHEIAKAQRESELQIARPLLITRDEAAALLTISPRKLWSMTNAGQVPCIRMGRTVRYCPSALREWVERSVQ
jgi:excisionase family DNA binding protein